MTKPPHVVRFPAGPTPQAWARPNDSQGLTLGCRGPKGPEKPPGKEGLKEWERGWKASISKAWKKLRGTVFLKEGKGLEGYFLQVQIDGQTMENVRDFISLVSKITADGDCSHEIKRR